MELPESFEKKINVPADPGDNPLWFVFKGDQLLFQIIDEGQEKLPEISDPAEIDIKPVRRRYLGILGSRHCFAADVDREGTLPANLEFKRFRRQYGRMDSTLFALGGYAFQMIKWERTAVFCSKCGSPLSDSERECAKICLKCDLAVYPKLLPAVIVAVVKGEQILLGSGCHFPEGMYSVLAGFVEPGESLEACVRREILEEVNIRVKNIQYFGSQFWPFSESLMVGFTAEYDSGEIVVNKNELADARWFYVHEIPKIPDTLSISSKLINWFISEQ